MPFTPFHLGLALCLGVPLRNYFHAPTFFLANIILDIEPLIVLTRWTEPSPTRLLLHILCSHISGYRPRDGHVLSRKTHTSTLQYTAVGTGVTSNKAKFAVAGILGTTLHVLFDSPMYSDIKPFYPLNANPLYGSVSSSEILVVCVWMGAFGVMFYALLLLFRAYKRLQPKQREAK
jgi:membrane-bound metal-dependent hydrolase YbcI (DUF457 family)